MRLQSSELNFIEKTREGILKSDFQYTLNYIGLSLKEMVLFLHVSERMIQKKHPNDKLPPQLSEQILYILSLYEEGADLFGNIDKFKGWMDAPNVMLEGKIPKSYLDTISGILFLSNQIRGMAHGFVI